MYAVTTRYLITGVNGFSGRHLALRLAREPHATVLGTGRRAEPSVRLAGYRRTDLTDQAATAAMVAWARADVVFHLAGLNGMDPPAEVTRVNLTSFDHLCQALRAQAVDRGIRVVVVGSAAELGTAPVKLPVDELVFCAPETAYGRSKHEIIRQALAEPRTSGLEFVAARPFNLIGPGLDARLALGSFASQLAAAVRGRADTIRCGALHTRRDYLDVRDAVEAYVAIAHDGVRGELYHVCAGQSYRIGNLLEQLIELAGVEVRVVRGMPARVADLLDLYGDHGKLSRLTGWQPTVPIEDSLSDLLQAALRASQPPRLRRTA